MTRLFALLALCCSPLVATAQSYPAKPITLIVPFPPGGSTDIIGRIAADGMARELGQPLVVDNRGGAGGAIGAKAIADAAPDGYTLGIATISTHVVNPVVQRDLRYDPLADFTFVSEIASVPNVVSVHPSVPARTLAELIALARQQPGKLNFGTPGVGQACAALDQLIADQPIDQARHPALAQDHLLRQWAHPHPPSRRQGEGQQRVVLRDGEVVLEAQLLV